VQQGLGRDASFEQANTAGILIRIN
jgi:hypothetical protein